MLWIKHRFIYKLCQQRLDATLASQDTIAFNAGTHREVIHMRTAEFRRLVSPHIVSLVREPATARGW